MWEKNVKLNVALKGTFNEDKFFSSEEKNKLIIKLTLRQLVYI